MYHIIKMTRRPYRGFPYEGYSGQAIDLENKPLEFSSLDKAREAVEKLIAFNPVGWEIYDSETGKLVE